MVFHELQLRRAVTWRLPLNGPKFSVMVVRPMADIEFDGAAFSLHLRSSRWVLAMRCFCVFGVESLGSPTRASRVRAGKKSRLVG
jgi:hypothetical protein